MHEYAQTRDRPRRDRDKQLKNAPPFSASESVIRVPHARQQQKVPIATTKLAACHNFRINSDNGDNVVSEVRRV